MKDKLKNKKVIAGIISGIAVITVVVIAVIILSQPKLVVKAETMDVEYGNEISTKAEDYLDTEKVDKDIIAKTNVTVDISNHDKSDNEYISIGEYLVKLTYEDETVEVKVNVKDTTKPIFDKFEKQIEITKDCKPAGEELNKLLEKFSAKDLQKVTISLDDSKVDYSKEGAYKATVKAIDASKNESTQETTIKIVKPTIKLDKKSESVYAKESFVLKATITGKEDKASFKSSNSSVASVDKNGKVTAKKKGTATITATANGVNAECKVTVKSVPSGSNTEKKTVTNPNTGKKEEVVVVKPSTPSGSSGSGSSNSNSTLTASISMEAFNLQNNKRVANAATTLVWSDELAQVALKRAKEISKNFDHTWAPMYTSSGTLINAENIAKGCYTADEAINGWFSSTGHRNNMLDIEYTKGAIARYGNYWVALFTK